MPLSHRQVRRETVGANATRMSATTRILWGMGIAITLSTLIWGNLVTRVFVVFLLLGVVTGYRLGASKVAAAFSGMVVAALLAVPLGKALEGVSSAAFGLSGLTNRMVSIAVVAVINLVIVTAGARALLSRVVKVRPDWKRYDQLCGSGLGLIQGALLGCLLTWSVLFLEPFAAGGLASTGGPDGAAASNPPAEYVASLAKSARESALGRAAEAVNPLDDIRLVGLLQKGLLVLQDPEAREILVRHPAVQGIREYPSVREAMSMFTADPQIQRLADSQADLTVEDIRSFLDSPTLLTILDETSIVADLSPIAADLEQAIHDALATAAGHGEISASVRRDP